MTDRNEAKPGTTQDDVKHIRTPAAERALAEAEERRKHYRAQEAALPKEIGGRGGHDPNRYGDWEIKGLTSDF
jgi:hypothetical protein